MKLLTVFLGLLACGSTTSVTMQRFELDLIILEDFINLMLSPLKEVDPMSVQEQAVLDIFGLHFNIKNLYAEGFSNVLSDISLTVDFPTISFNVLIQLPESVGSVELWENNMPVIYGKGSLSYTIKNAQLLVKIAYNLAEGFEQTVFKPSVEFANFNITGVNHNEVVSQHISLVLNSLFNDVFNDSRIHAIISGTIDMILNDIGREGIHNSIVQLRVIN